MWRGQSVDICRSFRKEVKESWTLDELIFNAHAIEDASIVLIA